MIIARTYRVSKILPYVWKELLVTGGVAAGVVAGIQWGDAAWLALPFAPLGVLGTALAIFLGFRSNTGYSRWWEARTIWGSVVNSSRILARLVISGVANAEALGKASPDELHAYVREIVHRQIAFAHALRLHLRRESDWSVLRALLPEAEVERVLGSRNRPNTILQIQSNRLKDGVRKEMLGPFDPISIEPNLAALNAWQGACERIKNTPMLSQYTFFTRLFVWLFLILMPSALASLFQASPGRWTVVPLSLTIGFIYAITSKVGEVNDDPFENRVHDVPMTALCDTIERDLREQLGEPTPPPPPAPPGDGYVF